MHLIILCPELHGKCNGCRDKLHEGKAASPPDEASGMGDASDRSSEAGAASTVHQIFLRQLESEASEAKVEELEQKILRLMARSHDIRRPGSTARSRHRSSHGDSRWPSS